MSRWVNENISVSYNRYLHFIWPYEFQSVRVYDITDLQNLDRTADFTVYNWTRNGIDVGPAIKERKLALVPIVRDMPDFDDVKTVTVLAQTVTVNYRIRNSGETGTGRSGRRNNDMGKCIIEITSPIIVPTECLCYQYRGFRYPLSEVAAGTRIAVEIPIPGDERKNVFLCLSQQLHCDNSGYSIVRND